MKIHFTKYQGTGNDFVMLDNLDGAYNDLSIESIQFLCDRKLGVGADGLIKISASASHDFEVEYFNADGSQSFCGNGARCSIAFAKEIGVIEKDTFFTAIDGAHKGSIDQGIVRLEMLPVDKIDTLKEDFFVDTGSPHYVRFKQVTDSDIVTYGKKVRYSEVFKKEGVNVNYLTENSISNIEVETYERGVEDETLSCGTGVTGCALVYMREKGIDEGRIEVKTKGGLLAVEAVSNDQGFDNIWLSGPAKRVFNGVVNV